MEGCNHFAVQYTSKVCERGDEHDEHDVDRNLIINLHIKSNLWKGYFIVWVADGSCM